MNENRMRKYLMDEYLKTTDGIPITELTDKLQFIRDTYQNLKTVLSANFDMNETSTCGPIKIVVKNGKSYLAIKLGRTSHTIVDIENVRTLSKSEIIELWSEDEFYEAIDPTARERVHPQGLKQHTFMTCETNMSEVVDFCLSNVTTFFLPTTIFHKVQLPQQNDLDHTISTLSFLTIDFINSEIRLGFRGTDQHLYEHLFFTLDLKPKTFQDSGSMTREELNEIERTIRSIKIPKEAIPEALQTILPKTKSVHNI